METWCLSVGVNDVGGSTDPLPQAEADALRFSNLSRSLGVPDSNVVELLGPDATRANILRSVRTFRKHANSRIIFYFAGHGDLVVEPNLTEHVVLLTHDVSLSDVLSTGLRIADLTGAIASTLPVEVYLFLDACRIDVAGALSSRYDDYRLQTLASRTTFAMSAAGRGYALEFDRLEPNNKLGGAFTSVLIDVLRATPSPTSLLDFMQEVNGMSAERGYSQPEVFLAGNTDSHPFGGLESPSTLPQQAVDLEAVELPSANLFLDDLILANQRIWLFGESARGKTTLLRSMPNRRAGTIYCSMPHGDDRHSSLESLVVSVRNQISEMAPDIASQLERTEHNLVSSLAEVERTRMYDLLIFDHIDRCTDRQLRGLLGAFSTLEWLKILVVANVPPNRSDKWQITKMPNLTIEEIEAFVNRFGRKGQTYSPAILRAASENNVLQLRALLQLDGADDLLSRVLGKDVSPQRRAFSAILDANGFVQSDIFAKVYELDPDGIESIVRVGLTQTEGYRTILHESALSADVAEALPRFLPDRAAAYWSAQLSATPAISECAEQLVEVYAASGSAELSFDDVARATAALVRIQNWPSLRTLGLELVSRGSRHGLWLPVARALVRRADFEVVDQMLDELVGKTDVDLSWSLIRAERSWWFGSFDTALDCAQKVGAAPNCSKIQSVEAALHQGIAHWFLGHWGEAEDSLTTAEVGAPKGSILAGWATMMLATTNGQRGIDLEFSRAQFIKSAAILEQLGDQIGAAVAWGNLGEMSWKSRDLPGAGVQLRRAIECGKGACGPQQLLEFHRNLIQVALRQYGPFSQQLAEAVANAGYVLPSELPPQTRMQWANTLATLNLLRGDVSVSSELIVEAEAITSSNAEYGIYTNANRALLRLLQEDLDGAGTALDAAIQLARKGNNLLALREISWNLSLARANWPKKFSNLIQRVNDAVRLEPT